MEQRMPPRVSKVWANRHQAFVGLPFLVPFAVFVVWIVTSAKFQLYPDRPASMSLFLASPSRLAIS
jgi:hypothetical protein